MKYVIVFSLAFFHLLFIFFNSVNHTISAYFDFYRVDRHLTTLNKGLDRYCKVTNDIAFSKPCMYYTKYTGAETGFGFFAPNVLSSGALGFTYKNKEILPRFCSYESKIRYSSLVSNLVSHTVNKSSIVDTTKIVSKKRSYKNYEELSNKFYDVVMKNIAAKIIADNNCKDTLTVQLYIYEFPQLKRFKEKNAKGIYLPLSVKKFSI